MVRNPRRTVPRPDGPGYTREGDNGGREWRGTVHHVRMTDHGDGDGQGARLTRYVAGQLREAGADTPERAGVVLSALPGGYVQFYLQSLPRRADRPPRRAARLLEAMEPPVAAEALNWMLPPRSVPLLLACDPVLAVEYLCLMSTGPASWAIDGMPAADAVRMLNAMPRDVLCRLARWASSSRSGPSWPGKVARFPELQHTVAADLVGVLDETEAVEVLVGMPFGRAADLVALLPAPAAAAVLLRLPRGQAEEVAARMSPARRAAVLDAAAAAQMYVRPGAGDEP
jgi:hypothetical protein